jgi:outer membrane protein assembly factor BamB
MDKYLKGNQTEISFISGEPPKAFEQLENTGTLQEYRDIRNKTFWENVGVGGSITARPIIHDDRIFFGACDKNFYCLGLEGNEKWKFATNGTIQSYAAAEQGRIYFGSGDRNLYCLNSQTGELIWKFGTDGQVGGSPVLHGGRAYFGSADGNLYCLDAETGQKIWIFRTSYPLITPLIVVDRIFVGYEGGSLYCLSLDGELQWKFNTDSWIAAWPAGYENGMLYFGSGNKNLHALSRDGHPKWKYHAKDIILCPLVSGGRIYVGCGDNRLYCISSSGSKLWDFQAEDTVTHVRVAGNTAYFGSYDNHMYAVDKQTGKLLWKFKTNGFVHTDPSIHKNLVIFGGWDCNLYCLTTEGRLLWKFQTSLSTPSKIAPPEETSMKKIELVMKSSTRKEVKKYKADSVLGNYEANVTNYATGTSKTYLSSKKRGYVGE